MDTKKTLTSEDRPGWYECDYCINPGPRVARHWNGSRLCNYANGADLRLVDYCNFVGPLVKPGETLQAADDPEVIDRVLDRVSDALRAMGVGELGKYHTHLEIVQRLRSALERKPFVLPEPGTAFAASFPAGTSGQFYRFGNGRVFDSNGQEWTAEDLINAELVEPPGGANGR